MNKELIASCGMNCNICIAHLRPKNKCPGCRMLNNTYKHCISCKIRNCPELKKNNWKYCNEKCKEYLCLRLKNLDKRYRTKYSMSMIKNLDFIHENGINKFMENEKHEWIRGDKIISVHTKKQYKIK